ncbi:hypothetical protein AB0368_18895 [Actinoplanes sp. NPDC051475]|uniref:hypothetical protein n=1 Tax=Actinoplanes sp. NPDC051475 TaxID=3157225 RepID=UPI00344DA98F
MSYAVQYPAAAAAPAPAASPRRPASVGFASVLLIVMAVVGLAYAVATLAVAPGTVDRFRGAAPKSADVDGFVTVVWIGAALGAVLAVVLFALYVVLALGLRRGSNGIRIATLVVCALGLVAGGVSTLTMVVQRGGDSAPGSAGAALADAYPGSWIAMNIGLGVAQMAGYVLVGVLLLAAPRSFFGRAPEPVPADPFPASQPGYGPQGGYPAGAYGYPGRPPFGAAQQTYGAAQPGYGAVQPTFGAAQPTYGAPYPAAPHMPAPVAEIPGEPSPWAAPAPVTPTAPQPSNPPAAAPAPADVADAGPWGVTPGNGTVPAESDEAATDGGAGSSPEAVTNGRPWPAGGAAADGGSTAAGAGGFGSGTWLASEAAADGEAWPAADASAHHPWPAPSAERPTAPDPSWAASPAQGATGGTGAGDDSGEGSAARPSS